MKKKSWLTKRLIEKTTISLRWDPAENQLFGIVQELKDKRYYLQHSSLLLQEMAIKGSNPKDLSTVFKLLLMVKIIDEESITKAAYAAKRISAGQSKINLADMVQITEETI